MFETNSSSMHSVIIAKDEEKLSTGFSYFQDTLNLVDYEIFLDLTNLKKFTREHVGLLADPQSKLEYLASAFFFDSRYSSEEEAFLAIDAFLEKIKKVSSKRGVVFECNGRKELELNKITEVIPFFDNKEVVLYTYKLPNNRSWNLFEGYMNHFVMDVLEDEDLLDRYLFESNSFVIAGGDEYDETIFMTKLLSSLTTYPYTRYSSGGEALWETKEDFRKYFNDDLNKWRELGSKNEYKGDV